VQRLLATLCLLNDSTLSKQNKLQYLDYCLQPVSLKRTSDEKIQLDYRAFERPILERLRKLLNRENTNNLADGRVHVLLCTHFEGDVRNFTIKKRKPQYGVPEDQISTEKYTVPLLLFAIKWRSPVLVNVLRMLGANFYEKAICIRDKVVAKKIRKKRITFLIPNSTVLQQAIDECHVELISAVVGQTMFVELLGDARFQDDISSLYHRFIRAFAKDKGSKSSPGIVKFKKIISLFQEHGLPINQLAYSPLERRDASIVDEFSFILSHLAVDATKRELCVTLIDWLYTRGAEGTDVTFKHLMFVDDNFLWPLKKDIETFIVPLLRRFGNIVSLPPSFDWVKMYLACILDDNVYIASLGRRVIEFSVERENLNAAHLAAGYNSVKVLSLLAQLDMALFYEKSTRGRFPLSYALIYKEASEFFSSLRMRLPEVGSISEEDVDEFEGSEIPQEQQQSRAVQAPPLPAKHESPYNESLIS